MEKKVNIFLALLYSMLKTAVVFTVSFVLLLLFFYDSLMKVSWHGEFGLFIFIEGIVLWTTVAVYFFGILLPAYFIDKQKHHEISVGEGIKRLIPVVSAFSVPAVILLIVGLTGNEAEEFSFLTITAVNILITLQVGLVLFFVQINSMRNAK